MLNRRSTIKSFVGILSLPFAAKAIAQPKELPLIWDADPVDKTNVRIYPKDIWRNCNYVSCFDEKKP